MDVTWSRVDRHEPRVREQAMTPLYYILVGAPELGDDLGRTAARTRRLTAKQRTDEGGGS